MIPVWIIASFQKIDAHSGTKFQSSLYLSYTGSQRSNIRKKCAMNGELLDKIAHLGKNINYYTLKPWYNEQVCQTLFLHYIE